MGPTGAGQLTKMVNQICIAGLVQGLAEGVNFGLKAGLDMHKVIDVISKGAAGSWQMENRHGTMIAGEYEHGFAVDWMRKDLGIVLSEADNNGASLPVTALIDQFYKDVQSMGGNRWGHVFAAGAVTQDRWRRLSPRPTGPPSGRSTICGPCDRRRTLPAWRVTASRPRAPSVFPMPSCIRLPAN